MERKKNFKIKNKEKQIQLLHLMENQKELEKIFSECLKENSRLKKKRSYWSTKCRKLESTECCLVHKNKRSLRSN